MSPDTGAAADFGLLYEEHLVEAFSARQWYMFPTITVSAQWQSDTKCSCVITALTAQTPVLFVLHLAKLRSRVLSILFAL